jgi:hypothetical protein
MRTKQARQLAHRLPVREGINIIVYHRDPTDAEIRFGYGATHYMDVPLDACCHPGTRIPKKWIKGSDGLRWSCR